MFEDSSVIFECYSKILVRQIIRSIFHPSRPHHALGTSLQQTGAAGVHLAGRIAISAA
jgi:hypothetical protein